jgi:hypothetical protein
MKRDEMGFGATHGIISAMCLARAPGRETYRPFLRFELDLLFQRQEQNPVVISYHAQYRLTPLEKPAANARRSAIKFVTAG